MKNAKSNFLGKYLTVFSVEIFYLADNDLKTSILHDLSQ